jgi:hypothetical protein
VYESFVDKSSKITHIKINLFFVGVRNSMKMECRIYVIYEGHLCISRKGTNMECIQILLANCTLLCEILGSPCETSDHSKC